MRYFLTEIFTNVRGWSTRWLFSTKHKVLKVFHSSFGVFKKFLPLYLKYLKGVAYCSTLPALVLCYFFSLNAVTLFLYFILVLASILNQWVLLFLFLLDIPIVTGVLSVLVMNPRSRPLVYSILGEDNVKFYLGNPGSTGLKLATRVGSVAVGAVLASTGIEMGQDLANDMGARRYWATTQELGIPGDIEKFQAFYDRKNPMSRFSVSEISKILK